jgi:hypothetical protein
MNWKRRTIIAASLGVSCSVGPRACAGGRPPFPVNIDDATGTVGSNGLDPDYYAKHRDMLTGLMMLRLTDERDSTSLNPAWGRLLDDDPSQSAITFVRHVLGCTVSLGSALRYKTQPSNGTGGASSTTLTFTPDPSTAPLLNDTSEWTSRPLDRPKWAFVHRCMAVRLNKTPSVQVWMAGGDVAPAQRLDTGAYPIIEAYWAVTMDGGAPTVTIWQPSVPALDGSSRPRHGFHIKWNTAVSRFCAASPQLCDFRRAVADTCTPRDGGGGWTCDGLDAIETRLSCSDCCDCTYPTPKDFCNQNGCSCWTPCPDGGTDGSPGG